MSLMPSALDADKLMAAAAKAGQPLLAETAQQIITALQADEQTALDYFRDQILPIILTALEAREAQALDQIPAFLKAGADRFEQILQTYKFGFTKETPTT